MRHKPKTFVGVVISVVIVCCAAVVIGYVINSGQSGGASAASFDNSGPNSYNTHTSESTKSTSVPGEKYEVCSDSAQYLTSPWTYHALAKGSASYTVAQYTALAGYGKTLPSLPGYIAGEGPQAKAAIIYAPGADVSLPAYQFPETPILQFFEGGSYPVIDLRAVTGDQFIGGSAPGYPEPAFNDGGQAAGISAQNDTFDFTGGTSTLAAAAGQGATQIRTRSVLPGYVEYFTFADGSTYQVAQSSGTSITLATQLQRAEPAGGQVWGNTQAPIASVASAARQGAAGVTLTASSVPLLPNGRVDIGNDNYRIAGVSGGQASYTLQVSGLDTAAGQHTPVYYDGLAGNVAVTYLNISHDLHATAGTIYAGSGWTIEHNDIHDSYSTPGLGVAVADADRSVIEFNCFSKIGTSAINAAGANIRFDYNEVDDTSYEKDPGCGCSGGGKWWGTLNSDIVANAFVNDGPGGSFTVWLDNGNSGTLISGNYFDKTYSSAISDETGFNFSITNNLFMDGGWGTGNGGCGSNCSGAVNVNSSGGFYVPGSRYENSASISGNQFIDDWMGVDIWQSGQRSCEDSGEGGAVAGADAAYCSGGFPNTATAASGGQYYFSHTGDAAQGGGTTVLGQPAAAGATSVLVRGAEAVDGQVGFSDPAMTTTGARTDTRRLIGVTATLPASTKGFPASGQLRVGTSAAWGNGYGSYTGAILAYTGTTPAAFTGVTLVRGSGTLSGPVQQVQPYRVIGDKCYANDCQLTITPGLRAAEPAGTAVTNTGTCQLYATSAALPSGPDAPDKTSYWDGCQWEARDITVSGNTFVFQPSVIASSAPLVGGTRTSCAASHPNGCGTNFMAFQDGGQAPFSSQIAANAMMSRTGLSGCPSWDSGCSANPLRDINKLAAPPLAPAGNGEGPYNDVWSGNKYAGPWGWSTYLYGTCYPLPADSRTRKSMPTAACAPGFSQWQSIWQQDVNSSYNPAS
jgi:hypothetical protein